MLLCYEIGPIDNVSKENKFLKMNKCKYIYIIYTFIRIYHSSYIRILPTTRLINYTVQSLMTVFDFLMIV